MSNWKPNPRIEIPVDARVKGLFDGQPFVGKVYRKDGWGYHVSLDRDQNVCCPNRKFRFAQITVPAYASERFNIEVLWDA